MNIFVKMYMTVSGGTCGQYLLYHGLAMSAFDYRLSVKKRPGGGVYLQDK